MNNNEANILTEEELENVVGGGKKIYEYELITGDPKGDYYRCTIYKDGVVLGHTNIGSDKWYLFIKRLSERGDSIREK